MYSFNFPKMLNSNTSNLLKDKEAIKSNLILLLRSERKSLWGDPYYGTILKQLIFEQANSLIYDLIIDELYTTIITFMPQIILTRRDIKLKIERNIIYATVSYTYTLDNTIDLYTIPLTQSENYE